MIWRDEQDRLYENCAVIFKVAGEFGGLSNMHNGYPLLVNGLRIGSSEALYQACRFPGHPDIQQEIIAAPHAFAAKLASRKDRRHERFTRPDWDAVRVDVMRWCLAVKSACNFEKFGQLLESTGERPIVERSRRDDFWGAKPVGKMLVGTNTLGKLLMELRARVRRAGNDDDRKVVEPPPIENLRLMGQTIGCWARPLKRWQPIRWRS